MVIRESNIRQIRLKINRELANHYDLNECESLSWLIISNFTGWTKSEIITRSDHVLAPELALQIADTIVRLKNYEPIQYIFGFAEFYGRKFSVNNHTLIPRPETEELCELVITREKAKAGIIIDIGTGSGCIAITLDLELPQSHVIATDNNKQALNVARRNAQNLGSRVSFLHHNILTDGTSGFEMCDVIVSNPPYIPYGESEQVGLNVKNREPDEALFVPDREPLKFYNRICDFGLQVLNNSGKLYFEINPNFAQPLRRLVSSKGYQSVELHTDFSGKKRFLSARR